MSQSFKTNQPIYAQIVGRLCRQLVRRELQAGDKLPSVRDMAVQSGVNPNTIQRVYAELERQEIAETRRGLGTFITESKSRLRQMREELKNEQIVNFIADMKDMGFGPDEIVEGVRKELANSKERGDY